MNIFRLAADLSHVVSILLLLRKVHSSSSVTGLSFKSQFLYLIVFLTRYIHLFQFWLWHSHFFQIWLQSPHRYNTVLQLVFIGTSCYTVYLMLHRYKPTRDPRLDTFKVSYLLGGSAVLAILTAYKHTFKELSWTFSIWLESVAILPQLFMLKRTGQTENITQHYIFALGLYRTLYIPNWIYRYFFENPPYVDPIAWVAGLLQTGLYFDFFYIYYNKIKEGTFKLPV